jgi:hypothetical protein
MSTARIIYKWAESLKQVSSYGVDLHGHPQLKSIAQCQAFTAPPAPAVVAAVERAATLWVETGGLFFSEEPAPGMTRQQLNEATAMICAKARVVSEAVYAVWMLEQDGVVTGSFHSETPDLAFLLVWKLLCPAASGWGDQRLRDALLEMFNSEFTP